MLCEERECRSERGVRSFRELSVDVLGAHAHCGGGVDWTEEWSSKNGGMDWELRSVVDEAQRIHVSYTCALAIDGEWSDVRCGAMEDGESALVVTYRSNSYARSRARVPWPKPVT
jgi:hypothetical protein